MTKPCVVACSISLEPWHFCGLHSCLPPGLDHSRHLPAHLGSALLLQKKLQPTSYRLAFTLTNQEVPRGSCMMCYSCKTVVRISFDASINVQHLQVCVCLHKHSDAFACVPVQLPDAFLFFLAAGVTLVPLAAVLLKLLLALCSCRRYRDRHGKCLPSYHNLLITCFC